MKASWKILVAMLAAFAMLAAACGSDDADDASDETTTTAAPAAEEEPAEEEPAEEEPAEEEPAEEMSFAAANYTTDLTGVCPDPFIVQKDWLSEIEHAAFNQLVGSVGVGSEGKFEGPLGSTGINLVVLEGGGGLGMGDGETEFSVLYTGNSKAGVTPHMAMVTTDSAAKFSDQFPVIAVVAPLDQSPQGVFYDPATYPEGFHSAEDLIAFAEGDTGKIYVGSITRGYGQYLVSVGVPEDVFVEGYAGDGENFVSNGGAWLNQGFVTNEVWDFENGRDWEKPVDMLLVAEMGYTAYPSVVSVATERLDELAPCLELLVPLIQQAQVDYVNDPAEVNQLIFEFNDAGNGAGFWHTPLALNEAGTEQLLLRELVSNGDNDTLGDMDDARTNDFIDRISETLGDAAKEGVTAADIQTNQFIDESIGL